MDRPLKQCAGCCGRYPLVFFRIEHVATRVHRHCVRCKRCDQERRDAVKRRDRFRSKAHSAIRTHAKKFKDLGLVKDQEEFQKVYGWTADQLEHDLRHAWDNGCPYCRHRFQDMEGGLSVMTVDIVAPQDPPHYQTNTRLVCATCNKEKQQTPPAEFGELLQCHRQWEENAKHRDADEYHGMPLFATMAEGP
jgi:hypothetical protein